MKFKLKIIWYYLKLIARGKLRSEEKLRVYQNNQLKKFQENVLSKSDYYKKYNQLDTSKWTEIPIISKPEFMSNFDAINTCGINLSEALELAIQSENTRDFKSEINGITVGLSTGTSGKRGVFLVSETERAKWVALVMQRVIQVNLFKRQKVAFFLRANSNLYSSVNSSLFEFKYFDIFKNKDELLKELEVFQPDILASQPSYLMEIAKAKFYQTIKISPTQIISFAEVLDEADKQFIKQVFPVQLSEVYQCTEGFLGCTCEHGTMHLNEDLVIIEKEWIDETKFYPIITDFSRESQPIVRYRLNDILEVKKEKCTCGSAFIAIEKIIGREDDVLELSGIKIYPDLLSRKIALSTDHFTRYTIVQKSATYLEIGIECESKDFEKACESFKNCISEYFTTLGISGFNLEFKNEIELIPGNKLRKIKKLSDEN
jgi:putative adenylate-forming enzyme